MKNFASHFLIYLTDQGAFFGYLKEREIIAQVFFATPEKFLESPFKKNLEKEPSIPLMILLDTGHQTYTLENLGALSWLEKISFLRHQKNRYRRETNLSASFPQSLHERMFVSIAEEPLNPWFSTLSSLSNPLKKITAAPLEIMRFINTLSFEQPCVLVRTLDKKFGARQVALFHKKLFLTRLIPIPQKGKINGRDETEKTIQYLSRQIGIAPSGIHVFDLGVTLSLKEMAKKIGLKHTPSPASLPLLLCAYALTGKSFVTFFPPSFNKKKILQYTGKCLTLTGSLFLVLGVSILAHTVSLSNKIKEIKTHLKAFSQDLGAEKVLPFSPLDQQRMIQEMRVVSSLTKEPHPFSFLNTVGPLLRSEWTFKQIKWSPTRAEVILVPHSPKATFKSLSQLRIPGYTTSARSLDGTEVQLTCSF